MAKYDPSYYGSNQGSDQPAPMEHFYLLPISVLYNRANLPEGMPPPPRRAAPDRGLDEIIHLAFTHATKYLVILLPSQTWPHVGDTHPQPLFDRHCLAIGYSSSGQVFEFHSPWFFIRYWIKLVIGLNAIMAQIITSTLSTDFLEQAQKSYSFNSTHVPVVHQPQSLCMN